MRILLSALASLLIAASASAAPKSENLDADAIRTQQAEIRAQVVARTGRYRSLDEADRQRLLDKQGVVNRLLEGKASVTDLPEAERIEVFNALEAISAIINDEEQERMVCTRRKPVGSNRPQTVCKTVAQLQAEQRAAEEDGGSRNLQCSEAFMGPGGCKR